MLYCCDLINVISLLTRDEGFSMHMWNTCQYDIIGGSLIHILYAEMNNCAQDFIIIIYNMSLDWRFRFYLYIS